MEWKGSQTVLVYFYSFQE